MKHFSLADVLDVLFYTAAASFLSLGLLRYFRVNTAVALSCSALVGAAVALLTALILSSVRRKKTLNRRESERRDALLLHLALEREEGVRSALLQALLSDGREARCMQDVLSVDGETYIPRFTMQPLSADAVAELLKRFGGEPFTLACNALSPEAEKLLMRFGKRAVCADEIYALFARTAFPEPLICGELPKKTAKEKLHRTFSKRNARPFFVSGILLLVMSLFAIFPVYYLVTGTVLLLSAVFVRAFGYA